MRIAIISTVVFLFTLPFLATDAMASDEVYRWVDENGVVHFGDQPPAETAAEEVTIQPFISNNASSPSGSAPTDSGQSPEPQPSVAQQIRDERAKKRAEIEENKKMVAEACAQRRELVSQLEPSTRVMVQMEDGTVTRLDDNVRMETLNEAQTYIAENCNK